MVTLEDRGQATYCGPLSDAGEAEQVLAALRPPHGLQFEPEQADRTPLSILLSTATATVLTDAVHLFVVTVLRV